MRLLVVCLALLVSVPVLAQEGEDFVGFGFFFVSDREGAAVVTAVAPGSAAEEAGMQAGDRIITVGGVAPPPFEAGDLLTEARDSLPAAFVVARGGETVSLSLGVGPYRLTPLRRQMAEFLCVAGDCWDGVGLWVHPSGDWYEGEFQNGVRHGAGKAGLADGRVHSGHFADGLAHGPGVYRWPDGSAWVGTFEYDRPQPPGVYTDEEGRSRPGLPE